MPGQPQRADRPYLLQITPRWLPCLRQTEGR